MGIGGINSCVISRPWDAKDEVDYPTGKPDPEPVSTA
jgi:hypothetical protein